MTAGREFRPAVAWAGLENAPRRLISWSPVADGERNDCLTLAEFNNGPQ